MKVVIPAAGLGRRFLPVTKSMPKEMLPVVDRPVIHYVVEEAVAAGATNIVIITGRGKRAVEDYFDHNPDLGSIGEARELEELEAITRRVSIYYIRQRMPKGLANAIYCAKHFVGNEPFGVLLGDTINVCSPPLLAQLKSRFDALGGQSSVLSVETVPDAKVKDYGIVKGREVSPGVFEVEQMVEKPRLEEAPSRLGITGAYFLTPGVFRAIEQTAPDATGETQLTTALNTLSREEKVYAVTFQGRRYDIGDRAIWLRTNIEFAMKDPTLRPAVLDACHEYSR
jgi:UTP--glucose-1-phosphate uridylyltransferase